MRQIFASFAITDDSRLAQVYYQDRDHQDQNSEMDHKELAHYAKAIAATKRIIERISKLPQSCPSQTNHEAFIWLSGFNESEERITIESILMVCGSQKWHRVQWCCSTRVNPDQSTAALSPMLICQKIQMHHKRKKKLHLEVLPGENILLLDPESNTSGLSRASKLRTTLHDLLFADAEMPNMESYQKRYLKKQERLDLGIRIVRSLLCLTASSMSESRWRSETLYACEDMDAPSPEKTQTKVYLLKRSQSGHDDTITISQLILDIGLLLWEIFFKHKVVPTDEDYESDDDNKIYNALVREHDEARNLFQDEDCLQIIGACLDVSAEADDLPELKLRVAVHEKIVKPLSRLLQFYEKQTPHRQNASHASLRLKDQFLSKFEQEAPYIGSQQGNHGVGAEKGNTSHGQSQWTSCNTLATNSHCSILCGSCTVCLAVNSGKPVKKIPSVNLDNLRASEDWFGYHNATIARINVERGRITPEMRSVRVVILDSGLELSQNQIDDYDLEVAPKLVYQSWIDGDDGKWKDKDGHGTHLAILLRTVAPGAAVFVARVYEVDPRIEAGTQTRVAKALHFAVDEWDVDIVVMPFGFGEKEKIMDDAIRYVASRGRLMFAAASNGGRNRPDGIAWPARDADVICVHSGNGDGTRSSFTPSAEDGMRVMVLGECVKSASPPHLNWAQDQMYLDGTSCATPIAAGIAALVLDYGRGFLTDEEWHNLRQTAAMKRMFKRMRDENITDYWWIKHWSHFLPTNTQGWIEGEIRLALST
ncbi:hypothetical protein FB567DRAFT_194918 [Paraphoma chrysanthemicola]|uniref:Peptidase S8/S53 domain-containing protein n=1 Tax=Paraphoma chrysanthemicola TaxID=798071 RepID=A0A8K0QVN0_9PLEO|nr:hypothetical protein FB567DRAFT_194918 [Paraphoma chrysanthemicola]